MRSVLSSGGVPVYRGQPQGPRPGGAPVPPQVAQSGDGMPGGEGGGKKRRRRRRRKRRGGGEGQLGAPFDPSAPVHFFSVQGQPQDGGGGGGRGAEAGGNGAGANGQKKRRRRRRRRGRGGRPDLPPGAERPQGDGQSTSAPPQASAPPPTPTDSGSRDGE